MPCLVKRAYLAHMGWRRGLLLVVLCSLLLAGAATGAPSPTHVHVTINGDIDSNVTRSGGVLTSIAAANPDAHFVVGDLSYAVTGQEQAWCDLVTSRVGAGFPFELLSGNHESSGTLNGNINDFSACLPNQLPGLVGTYGRQYYVDVPQQNPLVRFVMISPNLPVPRRHVELRRRHAPLQLDREHHRRRPHQEHPVGRGRHAQALPEHG